MPLGALSTLGAGGAAGVLVIRVDAEASLNHHHAVVMSVAAVLIWETDHRGVPLSGASQTHRRVRKKMREKTCRGGYLRPAGRREWCCTVVPGSALCQRRTLGCAFCPRSGTVPPSSAGPFHRSVSTARDPRQRQDFEPNA